MSSCNGLLILTHGILHSCNAIFLLWQQHSWSWHHKQMLLICFVWFMFLIFFWHCGMLFLFWFSVFVVMGFGDSIHHYMHEDDVIKCFWKIALVSSLHKPTINEHMPLMNLKLSCTKNKFNFIYTKRISPQVYYLIITKTTIHSNKSHNKHVVYIASLCRENRKDI